MATNDGGLYARIEAAVIRKLKTVTNGDAAAFNTVDHWQHQLALGGSGIESLQKLSPCALVAWDPAARPGREGDYDLNRRIRVNVVIGVECPSPRYGSSSHAGTSLLAALAINALDGWHPSATVSHESFACDDFYFVGTTEEYDGPKQHVITLSFEAEYQVTS